MQEGDDFNFEKLSIANGFTRGKKVTKDGWHGALLLGKGPSSLRLHAGRGTESRGGAQVGATGDSESHVAAHADALLASESA